jgi:hypothetical protein
LRAVAILAGAGAVVIGAPGSADAKPALTLSPSAGQPGSSVLVQGSGVARGSTGFIAFGGKRVANFRTNRRGRFAARFGVASSPPGRTLVTAIVRVGRKRVPGTTRFRPRLLQRATAIFIVERAATSPTSNVVWIVMENKSYEQVIGSSKAPYVNSLASTYGLATNMSAVSHPSLPNYIAMTSGSTQGVTDDAGPGSHPLSAESIFGQTHGDWRALQESMPKNCAQNGSGDYAVRHNPAVYYTHLAATCASRDVPLGAKPDINAKFTFITPNLCHDMHDCSVATGDAWLKAFVPTVLSTPEYRSGKAVVFLTWDENDGRANNHIATIVISPRTRGVRVGTAFTHYSVLRTTEELLGLPLLGAAGTAPSMLVAFKL